MSPLEGTKKQLLKRFTMVVLLAVAFGYIEAAVVVYLREIFYPNGFDFPLTQFGMDTNPLWRRLLLTEIGRETATLALIFAASCLTGRNRHQRFAFFLAIFAVWDISFYGWLKVLINWPASLLDWDILFLIPAPWASPVLAPVLVSLALFFFATLILHRSVTPVTIRIRPLEWLGFISTAIMIVASFIIAGAHVAHEDFKSWFHWWLFALGYAGGIACFARAFARSRTAQLLN